MARVTIIGTGFVGTAIGLALKERKADLEIVGHDRDFSRAGEARKLGAVDRAEWNLPSALEGAGMVVVTTPLGVMEKLFSQMAEFLEPGCIVTDTASLKGLPLTWASAALSGRAQFVGGHPIVDSHDPFAKPAASLFRNRAYCVVAAPDTSTEAVDQVVRFIQLLGADPLFIEADEHDSHLALFGNLPTIVANSLMHLATANPSWRDGRRLAGTAFGGLTAPTLVDPAEQRAQLTANRDALIRWIAALQADLEEMKQQLQMDPDELLELLQLAHQARGAWHPEASWVPEDLPDQPAPRSREQISSWFLGGLGGRRKSKP